MGATHFLTKSRGRVGTEMSLHVLAYNLKRVINIIGVRPLIQVCARVMVKSLPRTAISGS